MAQDIATSIVHRGPMSVGKPRRFISTLKSRRRGVYAATFFVLSVFIISVNYRINPAVSVDNIRTTPAVVLRTIKDEKAAAPDPGIIRGKPGECFVHVLYDKPVKTGSTAVTNAIKKYLLTLDEADVPCGNYGPLSCVERAKSVCNGTVTKENYSSILGHLKSGGRELVDCLRPNYYIVTSIREPFQRRKSAYLWNRTVNGTHFTIPHTATFKEFMNRMPRCQLHHYYDGKGSRCDPNVPIENRIKDIVDRVDEVIDLYDTPVGPLHKLIAGYIERDNESIKIDEEDYMEEFDRGTLEQEQMLYDELRKKRMKPPNPNRLVC